MHSLRWIINIPIFKDHGENLQKANNCTHEFHFQRGANILIKITIKQLKSMDTSQREWVNGF